MAEAEREGGPSAAAGEGEDPGMEGSGRVRSAWVGAAAGTDSGDGGGKMGFLRVLCWFCHEARDGICNLQSDSDTDSPEVKEN